MPHSYKHLVFRKEQLSNDRRTKSPPRFIKRDDISAHGQRLKGYLKIATTAAKQQIASVDGSYALKLNYDGALTFENLQAHGVEFISQEDNQLCVVFADEKGLAIFADHLARLGLNDADITYKQILEALSGIDHWTPEDRMSWAVQNKGFPRAETFILDVELWPVKVAQHPERNKRCAGFEQWLGEHSATILDKLNLDSLVMYRVQVQLVQAELLLSHSDVRLVDLTPETGISYQQLDLDINQIPLHIPSPADHAAKVCILDSGIRAC